MKAEIYTVVCAVPATSEKKPSSLRVCQIPQSTYHETQASSLAVLPEYPISIEQSSGPSLPREGASGTVPRTCGAVNA